MAWKTQALHLIATKLRRIFYDHKDSQFRLAVEITVINLIETSGYFAVASVMRYHMSGTWSGLQLLTAVVPSNP
jgi:hypothetical protein